MAAAFGKNLILDLDTLRASLLVKHRETRGIERPAMAVVTVCNQRRGRASRAHRPDAIHHFRGAHQADIGQPEVTAREAEARHINGGGTRSEEHTSEHQYIIRNSYADFCLQ